jgi:undecaprenyl diphosphate synthase
MDFEPPKHVAVIPDGNRRWARRRKLPTLIGHRKGFDRAVEVVRAARKMGIHTLTLWAFSSENWNRTKREVNYLMRLYMRMIDDNLLEAHEFESQIVHLGRKDRIPKGLADKIAGAEEETKSYKKYILNVALDYGGQDEIIRAIKRWFEVKHKKRKSIKAEEFSEYLDTGGQPHPYPDLVIRTSGEQRTSGLLLWQAAYSEFYFEKKCFPDFTAAVFKRAVREYSRRKRRFGGD